MARIVVFGASGGIGRQMVEQAAAAGHAVVAITRRAIEVPPGVETVLLDVQAPDMAVLKQALQGADVVVSALGPKGNKDAGIAARGTETIIAGMQASGVKRVVVVSAAPVSTTPSAGRPNPPRHDPGEGWLMRTILAPIVKRVLGGVYADLALMEDLLAVSGLDWTSVRPPQLTDGPLTRAYRTAVGQNLKGGAKISRADVAHFMLAVAGNPDLVGQAVGVSD